MLCWEIYPCVWVCLFIRIFISHLHEKHSRTRLRNLTLVFPYLYNFKNALLSSDISARYFVVNKTLEKGCRKNVHATIPKGNMGYDQYIVPDDCGCRIYFCCFPFTVANLRPWPLVPFFETVNSKPPTIPFGIGACTFSDNLSRNSCIKFKTWHDELAWENSRHFASLLLPSKRRLRRNERRNSILMTCHCPDLRSASDWPCCEGICFNQSEAPSRSG